MLDKQPQGEGRGGFGRGDGCARWRSRRWWQCLGSCYQTWLSRQRRKGQLYWRKLPFFHPFVLGSVLILIMQQLKTISWFWLWQMTFDQSRNWDGLFSLKDLFDYLACWIKCIGYWRLISQEFWWLILVQGSFWLLGLLNKTIILMFILW